VQQMMDTTPDDDTNAFLTRLTDDSSYAFLKGDPSISVFGYVPSDIIGTICKMLTDSNVLQSPRSVDLLMYVESEWQRLTDEDRRVLLPLLVSAFGRLANPTSILLISDLLGMYYANEDAASSFEALIKTSSDIPRSLIPSGLEKLIVSTVDSNVRTKANILLQGLLKDRYEPVIEETEDALARLATQFG
jgi:hypothetical protein